MNDGDERSSLVRRIGEVQRDLARLFADPRSSPIFDSNLTMRQLKVIMILAFHGTQSGQDLARRLGVGLATVTGIIDRLVAQHLVERREDPADRRVRRVCLTDPGRRLADQLLDAGTGHFQILLQHLDTETLRSLEGIMHKIRQAALEFCAVDPDHPDHPDHAGEAGEAGHPGDAVQAHEPGSPDIADIAEAPRADPAPDPAR